MGADGITNFWEYNFLLQAWIFATSCSNDLALMTSEVLLQSFPNSMIVMSQEQPKFNVSFG